MKKSEKPEQPESPETSSFEFEESEVEGSLRRIAETVRARKEAEADMKTAQAAYKAAKERYKEAHEEADQTAEAETTELPLFPRAKDKPAKPVVNADEPSATWLSAVDGMPAGAVVKLGEKGIQTVGELGEFTGKGGRLVDIEGIGTTTAEKIIAALEAFWRGLSGGEGGSEKGAA